MDEKPIWEIEREALGFNDPAPEPEPEPDHLWRAVCTLSFVLAALVAVYVYQRLHP
jgi:hypothetical protein